MSLEGVFQLKKNYKFFELAVFFYFPAGLPGLLPGSRYCDQPLQKAIITN